jgi:hypothetical protein
LNLSVAVGALSDNPPDWLLDRVDNDDLQIVESAVNPRRRHELMWSRGLKAGLIDYSRELSVNGSCKIGKALDRISISHDRHFAAVALSQFGDIGLDLQTEYPLVSCHRIAETWFPKDESDEILASDTCDRFLKSWVVKESWAKCTNRSIFEACQNVGIWNNRVYISDVLANSPQFAWSLQCSNSISEFVDRTGPDESRATNTSLGRMKLAMGICFTGNSIIKPDIDCLNPGPDSRFHRCRVAWEWIPVVQLALENDSQ